MHSNNRLTPALRALALGLLGIAAASAHPSNRPDAPPPSPATTGDGGHIAEHIQRRPLTADQRRPLPATRDHLRTDYDRPMPARAKGGCDVDSFASASGATLVSTVKGATTGCINQLFSVGGAVGAQVFAESKMVTIANAIHADAASYPGNNDGRMLQLVMFMRAGYFVQWYNPEVGDYGTALNTAIGAALNAFVANPRFGDVNEAHGEVLAEFVTLIDSAGQNAGHIGTVRAILDNYGPSHHPHWYMKNAVNNAFTVLFRGHYLDEFRAAVQVSPGLGLLDSLVAFVDDNKAADIGSDREYMLHNAAGELARFLNPGPWYGYPATFHNVVHPRVKSILDQFGISGPGAGIYVRMAGVVVYYDMDHCAYFGLCDFIDDLEAQVLPPAHARECSATLKVRSQALTSQQLDWVCAEVAGQEAYFHVQAQTGGVPVADDHNDRLEMVIFHSSTDYETYSGTLFGNDTNNGGMYLEGDPSVPGNQARFLAYEAEWLRPQFEVWNLTHEYIHYLDGRFNWHGAFWDLPLEAPAPSIWFIEGFAEYMSYSYRNLVYGSAVNQAQAPDRYTLSQVLDTTYSHDTSRIYQWGYLASRFMFERHRNDIAAMFALTRVGDYSPGYRNWLNGLRNIYDTEFRAWLVCFAGNNGNTANCGGDTPQPPAPLFADGFEGDDQEPPEIGECPLAAEGRLDNDCKIGNLSAAHSGARVWLSVYIPAGVTELRIRMSGGSGDGDLYYRAGNWPGDSTYDLSSTQPGNEEALTVPQPASGWSYLMLKPKSASFAGVEVSAHWH